MSTRYVGASLRGKDETGTQVVFTLPPSGKQWMANPWPPYLTQIATEIGSHRTDTKGWGVNAEGRLDIDDNIVTIEDAADYLRKLLQGHLTFGPLELRFTTYEDESDSDGACNEVIIRVKGEGDNQKYVLVSHFNDCLDHDPDRQGQYVAVLLNTGLCQSAEAAPDGDYITFVIGLSWDAEGDYIEALRHLAALYPQE